jgi:hypothetical protein
MAGMGNLANGFFQGVNLADQFYTRRNMEALAKTRDRREQERFDMQKENFDLEKEIRLRETAGQKLYALSLNDDGTPREFSTRDNEWINKTIVPVMNRGKIFNDFLAANPDVDQVNPIARLDISDDGRVMVGLKMRDGSVKPATENRSSDPDDPLWSPTVQEFMHYAQIESDPRGVAARIQSAQQRRTDLADKKQGMVDQAGANIDEHIGKKKADLAFVLGMKGMGLDTNGKPLEDGKRGGWQPDEAEKHIKSLVATGMGLNRNSFDNWDEDQQREFASTVAAVLRTWRQRPELGISGAYEAVTGGTYVTPGGDRGYRVQGRDGQMHTITDADIQFTAEKYGITEEAARRQLGISE